MAMKEILERIETKLDEQTKRIEVLNGFVATYTERSAHCAIKFIALDTEIKTLNEKANWNRTKILIFMGVIAGVVYFLDKVLKF